jgi:capsular polysaccharide transport system permease protein
MSFMVALRAQEQVLSAILRREIGDQVGKGGYRLMLGVLEPLFALSVAVVWHTLIRIQPAYGNSKWLFIASGLYPTYVFVHLSSGFRNVAKGSTALRRFPIEKSVDFVFAACFMKLAVYSYAGIIGFSLIYLLFTPQAMPADWVSILHAILAIAILGLGMGLCNAALEQLIPVWRFIWIPIARGLVLFSGVIYVPDFLSVHIRTMLAWNPVLQGVELFRHGFWPGYPNECYSPYYLWSFSFTLLLLGLCADRVFRRHLDDPRSVQHTRGLFEQSQRLGDR